MKKAAQFTYSVLAYLVGFSAILFWILSVSGLVPEISIDREPATSPWLALLNNLALIALFGVQHSVMARPWFKAIIEKYFPRPVERSTYVLISGLLLFLMVGQWQPLGGTIWAAPEGGPLAMALYALSFLGWTIMFISTFLINHFDLFGLRQTFLELQGKPYTALRFRENFLYKRMRHPLYFGFLLGMWAAPVMTATHLLFALCVTAYTLVGVRLEEKDLVAEHGEQYREYSSRVPKLIPFTKRKRTQDVPAIHTVKTV